MLTIRGVFDGTIVKPLEPVPFKSGAEVIITFLDERRKTDQGKGWRNLRGSAKGENLLEALLRERQEDLSREH